jgi:diguanylate cyclase (GGDEF)-like protein
MSKVAESSRFFRKLWRSLRACAEWKCGSRIICDLDQFKQINDGHGVGDTVLRSVATEAALMDGIVGRLDGEEFGILVEAPLSDAFAITESFRRTIGEMKILADKAVVK